MSNGGTIPPGQLQMLIDEWRATATALREALATVVAVLPVSTPAVWQAFIEGQATVLENCADDAEELMPE